MQSTKKIFWLAIVLWLIFNRGLTGNIGYLIFDFICTLYIIRYGINGIITKYTLPLLLLPVFPLVMGICGNNIGASNFDIFKDLYYFLNPIFAIVIGQYIAMKNSTSVILRAVKLSGILSTVVLSVSVFLSIGIDGLINPREAREVSIIQANLTIIIAASIYWYEILFSKRHSIQNKHAWLGFILCIIGVYLSGTRTIWISEIIFMFFTGWSYYKKHLAKTIISISTCCCIVALIFIFNPNNTMVKLILNSKSEISSNHSFTNGRDINVNWRGYETYMAHKLFEEYNLSEKILGHGFGTKVDVKSADYLGMRYIPILHNGYPYILVKSGYLGTFLLFVWGIVNIYHCSHIRKSFMTNAPLFKYLSIASIITLFVTNSSVTAYVNPNYNGSLFIIGVLYYYYAKYLKIQNERLSHYRKLQYRSSPYRLY